MRIKYPKRQLDAFISLPFLYSMIQSNPASQDELKIPAEAKRRLGIDRLVLQVHASSFPMDPDEDLGRGSPYSKGADRLLAFAARLGFDAIQLGPMGLTERGDPSPYNATIFSRNPMDLPLARMLERELVPPAAADEIRASAQKIAGENRYAATFDIFRRLAKEIGAHMDANRRSTARRYLASNASWLVPDALYEVLCTEHDLSWWGDWHRTEQGRADRDLYNPEPGRAAEAAGRLTSLRRRYAGDIEHYALIQALLAEEHRSFHERAAAHGLDLFGDLQIGLSARDVWARKKLFLAGYNMGAPPSRTNPEGQPWGYPVYDPRQFGTPRRPGPVLQFVESWLEKMLDEYDGVRIDHPHGWIDPWVYRTDDDDIYRAVRNGARLLSSPDEALHPELRNFAIVSPDQINRAELPYADQRIQSLTEDQTARYALLFDAIVRKASSRGLDHGNIACEILSTLPYQVRRVLDLYGLGRFRVAQKILLGDSSDVYRIENAQPEDWITMGTHDTASIWERAADWHSSPDAEAWGRYLAPQLVPRQDRGRFAAECAFRPGNVVHAVFAAMLAARPRQILVFFPDLLGMTERYNRPGEVHDQNWALRIPFDFEQRYEESCRRNMALDIHKCFAMALSAPARNAS